MQAGLGFRRNVSKAVSGRNYTVDRWDNRFAYCLRAPDRNDDDADDGFDDAWAFDLDFSDASDLSDRADEAMHWCVMNGIFEGDNNGALCPGGGATRAESAAILMRFCELMG